MSKSTSREHQVYGLDGVRISAGCVPVRIVNYQLEVLVVKSTSGNKWILPKGGVESGETHPAAALRESEEEAGVKGSIIPGYEWILDTESTKGKKCRISMYVLQVEQVLEEYLETHRERRWVSPNAALAMLRKEFQPVVQELCAQTPQLIILLK